MWAMVLVFVRLLCGNCQVKVLFWLRDVKKKRFQEQQLSEKKRDVKSKGCEETRISAYDKHCQGTLPFPGFSLLKPVCPATTPWLVYIIYTPILFFSVVKDEPLRGANPICQGHPHCVDDGQVSTAPSPSCVASTAPSRLIEMARWVQTFDPIRTLGGC